MGKKRKDGAGLSNPVYLENSSLPKERLMHFLKGMSGIFVVLQPNRVDIQTKDANERIRRSWARTGRSVQLAIEQYECNNQQRVAQDVNTEHLQDVAL